MARTEQGSETLFNCSSSLLTNSGSVSGIQETFYPEYADWEMGHPEANFQHKETSMLKAAIQQKPVQETTIKSRAGGSQRRGEVRGLVGFQDGRDHRAGLRAEGTEAEETKSWKSRGQKTGMEIPERVIRGGSHDMVGRQMKGGGGGEKGRKGIHGRAGKKKKGREEGRRSQKERHFEGQGHWGDTKTPRIRKDLPTERFGLQQRSAAQPRNCTW